jgi:uncharacterized RDD family membrane protein YckC
VTATASTRTYAGFWIRVLAFLLDGIVVSVIAAALSPAFGAPIITTVGQASGTGVTFTYTSGAASSLLGFLYFIGFWGLRGQTPGMMPFHLSIVKLDGSRPNLIEALLRYVGLIISFVVILLGVIWVAFDARKQGWHDKIAGTLVVRDTPGAPAVAPPPPG